MTRRGLFAMLAGLSLMRRLPVVKRKVTTLAQADWISHKALQVLSRNLKFNYYAGDGPQRPRVGGTITIRKPVRFVSTECNR